MPVSDQLIELLIEDGYLKTPGIIEAFRSVRREDFVLPEELQAAGYNVPLPIGFGQTISQPATVAFALELLQPEKGDKILDVGSGSGWTTALMAHIAGAEGRVYGMEIVKELKKFGEGNVARYGFIGEGRVKMFKRDGYQGLPEYAPFDKILVSAAAESIPEKLFGQLKTGGRMVIPLGREREIQDIAVIDKTGENDFKERRYPGFVFVPMVRQNR